MIEQRNVTFAVATNSALVLRDNFLASPLFCRPHSHQFLIQSNFTSAARAYNDAIDRSANDLIVFAHQDVIFPQHWIDKVEYAIGQLKTFDPAWAVLGCYGQTRDGIGWGHVYSSGRGVLGLPFHMPVPIQTLDEIVLILRRSSGLRFDESLPGFHMYGTDICLSGARRGLSSYAISAFCIHNTQQNLVLPKDFYDACQHVRRAWWDQLPIHTPTITLTRRNTPVITRRTREVLLRLRRKKIGAARTKDPRDLIQQIEVLSKQLPTASGISLSTRIGWYLRGRRVLNSQDLPRVAG